MTAVVPPAPLWLVRCQRCDWRSSAAVTITVMSQWAEHRTVHGVVSPCPANDLSAFDAGASLWRVSCRGCGSLSPWQARAAGWLWWQGHDCDQAGVVA